ncbi:unnamed protein product [Ectocarpus sp. 6 AP-2014]
MRGAERFVLILALLLSPQQGQCFRIPSSLRRRECTWKRRSSEDVHDQGSSPPPPPPRRGRHKQPQPAPRRTDNSQDLLSSQASPATRRELASRARLLGAVGVGAALARPLQAAVGAPPPRSPPAAPGFSSVLVRDDAHARLEDDGVGHISTPSGGSGLVLPAVAARTKRIFLARHGQTDLNKLGVCQGRKLNPPLNEHGQRQARTLLIGVELDAILCSPLRRARETAGIVRESHPLATSFAVSEDLNEVDFGGAEGLPQMASAAILAPSYLAWSHGRLDKRAGVLGESGVMLRRRGEAAAGTLLASCKEGRQVLGVSHSSMIKFTLAALLDVPLSTIRALGQDNCAVNALDFDTTSGVFEAVAINGRPVRGRAESFGRVGPETC